MIAIGFEGSVGLGVSTIYFLIMQPMEHHPTPSYIADPTSDYNRSARQDNTRYVNPYKPLY